MSQTRNLIDEAIRLVSGATATAAGAGRAATPALQRQCPPARPLGAKTEAASKEEQAARLARRQQLQEQLIQKNNELDALKPKVEAAAAAVAAEKDAAKKSGNKKWGKNKKNLPESLKTLLALKKSLGSLEEEVAAISEEKDREKNDMRNGVANAVTRNFIYTPSAEIHGAVAGLFDYGPCGSALKANWIQQWRNWFVIEEDMLEVDCAVLTPYPVLKTSGHVDKFEDMMCKDEKTLACHRGDHLLEQHIDELLDKNPGFSEEEKTAHLKIRGEADAYTPEELTAVIRKYDIKSPDGNELSDCYPFNLMFGTQIGPTGKCKGYLRPETAQSIFVNFRKLLEYNNDKMPFAAAQIGLSFRNEIAPRAGLLRVREFQQAEIEHFCEPDVVTKDHPKFKYVRDLQMSLLPAKNQDGTDRIEQMTIGEAVDQGLVSQTTLGYYMARTALFMEFIGIKMDKLRFRQHREDEMAHYARDCWDVEIESSYGWVECVGIADRACFDLSNHAKDTGTKMTARKTFAPRKVDYIHKKVNKKALGKKFRKDAKKILAWVEEQSDADYATFVASLDADGKNTVKLCTGEEFELEKGMMEAKTLSKTISSEEYVPGVVEPSFGLGRVIYSLLEHVYWRRPSEDGNDEKDEVRASDASRTVLSFRPLMAPLKVAVLPLSNKPKITPTAEAIHRSLKRLNVASRFDDSGASVGKKYARADEQGIPFAVTIDFETEANQAATVRERDTGAQILVPLADLPTLLRDLALEEVAWAAAFAVYPRVKNVMSG